MKIKILIMFLFIASITNLVGCNLFSKNKGLEMEGNCYDNLKNFSSYSKDTEMSELSQAYLSTINYEIIEINEDTLTVTMNIKIPLVANEIPNIVHSVVSSNTGASYDDLKNKIQEELLKKLSSDSDIFEIKTTKIELPIQEIKGKYKIVSTDEFSELIYSNLRETYINIFSQIGDDFK